MFPSYLAQNKSFVHPSLSILSNMADSTTPIVESTNEDEEDLGENPYIDVSGNELDRSDTDSELEEIVTDHYGQVPKNTLCINLRHRSRTVCDNFTGLETARQTYQKVLYQDFQRSSSLPAYLRNGIDGEEFSNSEIRESVIINPQKPTETSERNDEVYINERENEIRPVQRKTKNGSFKIFLQIKSKVSYAKKR